MDSAISPRASLPQREEYATRLESKTPCCAIPVRLDAEPAQVRTCPWCENVWRIDITLVSRRQKPGGVESLHRLYWTLAGELH